MKVNTTDQSQVPFQKLENSFSAIFKSSGDTLNLTSKLTDKEQFIEKNELASSGNKLSD